MKYKASASMCSYINKYAYIIIIKCTDLHHFMDWLPLLGARAHRSSESKRWRRWSSHDGCQCKSGRMEGAFSVDPTFSCFLFLFNFNFDF